ncbi:DUF6233 domain-containing protein [Streptomyces sp. NPDC054975]
MPISERLEKKRAVLAWLDYQRNELRREIRDLEVQEREQSRRVAVARAEMMWRIEPSRVPGGEPVLHRGGCGMSSKNAALLSRDEVMAQGERTPAMEMCEVCSPWGSLGFEKPWARKRSGEMS